MSTPTAAATQTTRVRSGLSITVPVGWTLVDAIEARGPGGIGFSAASYPVDGTVALDGLAANDTPPGTEPVGTPEAATVVGRPGLLQRFDAADERGGFTQLAGYALGDGRAYVVRASCPRDRAAQLDDLLRSLIAHAAVDASPRVHSPEGGPAEPASALQRFLDGDAVVTLDPYETSVDFDAVHRAWTSVSPTTDGPVGGRRMVMTGAELVALGHAVGQATFPGVVIDALIHERPVVERFARSTLLARSLLRVTDDGSCALSPTAGDIVTRAFRAELVLQVTQESAGERRTTAYFTGPDGALELRSLPANTYACGLLPVERVMDLLMARIETDRVPAQEPALADDIAEPTDATVKVRIEVATVHGDRVDLDSRTYLRADGGEWCVEAPDGQLQAIPAGDVRADVIGLVFAGQ